MAILSSSPPRVQRYLNPSILFPWSEWPRRSTLIQLPDFSWEVVEHCVPYFTKINYEDEIAWNAMGSLVWFLTMLHKKEEPLSTLGAFAR